MKRGDLVLNINEVFEFISEVYLYDDFTHSYEDYNLLINKNGEVNLTHCLIKIHDLTVLPDYEFLKNTWDLNVEITERSKLKILKYIRISKLNKLWRKN